MVCRHSRVCPAVCVIDLCCGLGGLSLAAKELGMSIVAGVDLNSTALKTFSRNFPEAQAIEGSVRSATILERCERLLKPCNGASPPSVILSGPPCQGFSAAGSRNPTDRRNQVLVAVARAISKLQPHCALLENVSMLLADKHADRIGKFERTLADGGFYVTDVLLDASDFGVSQKRKRAFFLVTRHKLDEQDVIERLERYKVRPKGAKETLQGLSKPKVRPDDYDDETDYGGIHNHFAMRHSQRVMDKIAAIQPGTGPMSYRRLHPTRLSNTLFSGHRCRPRTSRRLAALLCERLPAFKAFRTRSAFSVRLRTKWSK